MKRLLALSALVTLSAGLLVAPPADAGDFDAVPHVVRDPTAKASASDVEQGIALGSRVIYSYGTAANGYEPWVTDGTKAGTHLLREIEPGSNSSSPSQMTAYKGKVYFRASDEAHGNEIWVTDGTSAGTKLYKDVLPGPDDSATWAPTMAVAGGTLYFIATTTGDGAQVWRTNGNPADAKIVQVVKTSGGNTGPRDLTAWGNRLVWTARDNSGSEPWITDGTTTSILRDVNPGAGDSNADGFTVVGSRLFFTASSNGTDNNLYVSAPTSGNLVSTDPVVASPTFTDPLTFASTGKTLYFTAETVASGRELYRTDGTSAGTTLAKDVNLTPGVGGSFSDDPGVYNHAVYFTAADTTGNYEFWRANDAGVTRVKEIVPGSTGSNPGGFHQVGALLFFSAQTPAQGDELWQSDGTSAGTKVVKDIVPGKTGSDPEIMAGVGNTVFFAATTPKSGKEVWAYTFRASTTTAAPKASYTRRAGTKKKIVLVVKVKAAGAVPTGKVVLKQGSTTVGTGTLKNGVARIHVTKKYGKGTHNVRAYYLGSVVAHTSSSAPIHLKVR